MTITLLRRSIALKLVVVNSNLFASNNSTSGIHLSSLFGDETMIFCKFRMDYHGRGEDWRGRQKRNLLQTWLVMILHHSSVTRILMRLIIWEFMMIFFINLIRTLRSINQLVNLSKEGLEFFTIQHKFSKQKINSIQHCKNIQNLKPPHDKTHYKIQSSAVARCIESNSSSGMVLIRQSERG